MNETVPQPQDHESMPHISVDELLIGPDHNGKTETKARTEKGKGYPDRQVVPDDKVDWQVDYPEYNPPYYVAESVLANDRTTNSKGWADPESFDDYSALQAQKPRVAYHQMLFDDTGKPLNPQGRTGIMGRGLLGNWGPNNAADPIVTMVDDDGFFRIAAIKRADANQRGVPNERALPGGMVDAGERLTATLSRELREETTAELDFDMAKPVYQGTIDDPRNTDNAWMVTDAYHLHLEEHFPKLSGSDDAAEAGWLVVNTEFLSNMYASHAELVIKAIRDWQHTAGFVIRKDGKVGKKID